MEGLWGSSEATVHAMVGANIGCFAIRWDGHQSRNRNIYTDPKDSHYGMDVLN